MPKSKVRALLRKKKQDRGRPPSVDALRTCMHSVCEASVAFPIEAPVVGKSPFMEPVSLRPEEMEHWQVITARLSKAKKSGSAIRRLESSGFLGLALDSKMTVDSKQFEKHGLRDGWARLAPAAIHGCGDGEAAKLRAGLYRLCTNSLSPCLNAGCTMLHLVGLSGSRDDSVVLSRVIDSVLESRSDRPEAILKLARALESRSAGLGMTALHCAAVHGSRQWTLALVRTVLEVLQIRLVARGQQQLAFEDASASPPKAHDAAEGAGAPADDKSSAATPRREECSFESRVSAFRRWINAEVMPADAAFEAASWGPGAPGLHPSADAARVALLEREEGRGPSLLDTVRAMLGMPAHEHEDDDEDAADAAGEAEGRVPVWSAAEAAAMERGESVGSAGSLGEGDASDPSVGMPISRQCWQ